MIKVITDIASRKDGKLMYSKVIKLLSKDGKVDQIVRFTPRELFNHARWIAEYEYTLTVAQLQHWRANFLAQEMAFIERRLKTDHDDTKRIESLNTQSARWIKSAYEHVLAQEKAFIVGELKKNKKDNMLEDYGKLSFLEFADEA